MIETLAELWIAWTIAFAAGLGAGWLIWARPSIPAETHQDLEQRYRDATAEIKRLKAAPTDEPVLDLTDAATSEVADGGSNLFGT